MKCWINENFFSSNTTSQFSNIPVHTVKTVNLFRLIWRLSPLLLPFLLLLWLLSLLLLLAFLLGLITMVSVPAVFLFLLFLGTVHAVDAVLSCCIFIFRFLFNFFNIFFICQHFRKLVLFIEFDNFFYSL